ncbi:hypothetical protein DRN63_03250 [Nanoarchaeota archaeon]|nr:MAG: hypothetical protein DRN63_03250 [Nanoarchaeota archaeon]
MEGVTIATLPLYHPNIGTFEVPKGYAVLDIETYRIIDRKEIPPLTLIGIGFGSSYVRVRVEGEERRPMNSLSG